MPSALNRLSVLDFSRVLAGPFATMVLGDLGAEVTKVERPGTGDETRSWVPPTDEQGRSTYFQAVNRNKVSIALELSDASDVARARALARQADVVVENFRPGVMERLGLGYAELARHNPGLVYCSISAFGHGEGASLPGYDLLVQALGGLMSITGDPDGDPQKVGVALVDVLAGLYAAVGILAALRYRDETGRGQRIEVNLLSSLLASLVNQGSAYTVAGVVAGRMGNAHPSIAPYELFQAGDGEIVIAVGNDRQFAALCRVLGGEEIATDSRFATNAVRVANRRALRSALAELIGVRATGELADELLREGVPAGRVNDIAGAFELAGRLGLDPIVPIRRSDGSVVGLTRSPLSLSETPPRYDLAPPDLPAEPEARPEGH